MTKFSKHLFTTVIMLMVFGCVSKREDPNSASLENEVLEESYHYQGEPLKVAVIGLTHTHVHWILGREDFGDIEIIGIVEPNRDLAERFCAQHNITMDLVYDSMEALYSKVQPEAVFAFNSIYEHLETVEFFAPKGVHVMVEKPLAVSWEHAKKMESLARKHNIKLLTNYETSWYGSNHEAYRLALKENLVGPIQRMVFHHGHQGPIEIGCNQEFLEWLTDPVQNGGGAITDFGCYGANLSTWFMQGRVPVKVTAITRQFKPEKYPNVDDDATIILDYPKTQVVLQASWNWSHNRKDMELYGNSGYIICKDGTDMELLENEEDGPYDKEAVSLKKGFHDPFALFTQIVKNKHQLPRYDLSSLENNFLVVKILEAAKASAQSGETIIWNDFFKTE